MKKILLTLLAFAMVLGGLSLPTHVYAASTPRLKQSTMTLAEGMSQKISFKNKKSSAKLTFESEDASVATVDAKGQVAGVMDGTTTVDCTLVQSGKTYNLPLKVTVTTPKLKQTEYKLFLNGDTEKLEVSSSFSKAKFTYTSEDTSIVKVNSSGTLTAVGVGATNVTVKIYIPKSGTRTAITLYDSASVTVEDAPEANDDSNRQVESLNGEWSFTDYNGNQSTVTVPHDWEYYTANAAYNPMLIQKKVTYEKTIDVSAYEGKEIFLQFGAVNKVATVYVDDEEIGTHTGGYTAFQMDITEACEGKDSVKVKVVNTNATFDTIPVNTDFTHYAGIYRDVNLVAVDKEGYISLEDDGSEGVNLSSSVTLTKSYTGDKGTVKPTIQLSNLSDQDQEMILTVNIKDDAGTTVAKGVKAVNVAADTKSQSVTLNNVQVSKPHLWNGTKDPYLYTVETTVFRNDEVVDQNSQKIGFRQYKAKGGNFYLNGKKYQIKGVGMHQQNDGSYVSTDADIQQSIDDAMEMGANAIRTSHYPHSQETYELCDEKGIVVWCEIPYYLITLSGDTFKDNVKQNLTEMVKQYRNHTSIIVWGIENEVYYPEAYAKYYNLASKTETKNLMLELASLTKELDSTRMIGEAQINNADHVKETTAWTTKKSGITTVGFNIYAGWYSPIGNPTEKNKSKVISYMKDRINSMYSKFKSSSSGTANYCITEYGAGGCIDTHLDLNDSSFKWGGVTQTDSISTAKGYTFSNGNFHPEEFQCYIHEADVKILYGDKTTKTSKNSKIWGAFAWSLYDFSCYRNEGSLALTNTKGLITADRKTKKDAFYLYKAIWNTDDYFTHLCSKRFTDREKQTIDVKAYSNCSSVTLTVNGQSYGKGKKTQDGVFVWYNVKLNDLGEANSVEVTGTQGSETYTDSCEDWVYVGKEAETESEDDAQVIADENEQTDLEANDDAQVSTEAEEDAADLDVDVEEAEEN